MNPTDPKATPTRVPTANGFSVPVAGVDWERITSNAAMFDRWCGMVENISSMRKDMLNRLFDERRNVDHECGYPESQSGSGFGSINPEFYRTLYEREAVAWRAVRLMALESWQVSPLVFEDEDPEKVTPFEQAWDKLGTRLRGESSWYGQEEGSPVWDALKRLDILSGIGHFGVLLLGFADGKNLDMPVDGVVSYDPTGNCASHRRVDWSALVVANDRGKPVGMRMVLNGIRQAVYPTSPRAQPDPLCKELEVDTYPVYAENSDPKFAGLPKYQGRTKYENMPKLTANGITASSLPSWAPSRGSQVHFPQEDGTGPAANELPARFRETSMESAQDGARPNFQHATPPRLKKGTGWGNQAPADGSGPPGGFVNFPSVTSGQLGTDAQYVGVQLSPSEFPSSEPAAPGSVELLFARPFDESLVQIVQYEANVRNPRFGLPVMYRITLNDPREQHSGIGLPMATVRVHWSRVIHVPAANRGSSQIFGVPELRPVLNRVLDLRKVYGADAEGFWQYSFPKLALSTHPQLGGDVKVDVPSIQNMLENVRNGLQKEMLLMGMGATTVNGSVADPTPHINIQIEAVCIAKGCPMRIFKGAERGEQASTQDDSNWNGRLKERQHGRNTPDIVVPFVDRLIGAGVLPVPGVPPLEEKTSDAVVSTDEDQDGGDDGDESTLSDVADLHSPSRVGRSILGRDVRNAFPPSAGAPKIPGAPPSFPQGKGAAPPGTPKLPGGSSPGTAAPSKPKIDVPDNEPVGYSIEWPDLDNLGDKDHAQVALQITQALAAYVSGGIEAVMPVFEYLVHICGFKEEMVTPMLQKIRDAEDDNMTIPPAGEDGHPATPPAPPPTEFVDGTTGKSLKIGPDGKPIVPTPPSRTPKPGDGNVAEMNDKRTDRTGGS